MNPGSHRGAGDRRTRRPSRRDARTARPRRTSPSNESTPAEPFGHLAPMVSFGPMVERLPFLDVLIAREHGDTWRMYFGPHRGARPVFDRGSMSTARFSPYPAPTPII